MSSTTIARPVAGKRTTTRPIVTIPQPRRGKVRDYGPWDD